jgi:phage baseplate assembly protein W
MSTLEKNLYKQITVKSNKRTQDQGIGSRAYRGISTVNPENSSTVLYDLALIKQDLLNHFHIRQGEKLSDPEFGTIIWDALFEPLTDDMRNAIKDNVTEIVNYDPRVSVNSITVDQYESGIQIEVSLVYLPYNISESLKLRFDENAGFLNT